MLASLSLSPVLLITVPAMLMPAPAEYKDCVLIVPSALAMTILVPAPVKLEDFIFPTTSKALVGLIVPIPTFTALAPVPPKTKALETPTMAL